ncbi:MAG: ATP-binding cassette domain-containing protein [Candidatus Limnocylindrales bacterium]|jgi:ABC-2 type transport system ATP-binding protein
MSTLTNSTPIIETVGLRRTFKGRGEAVEAVAGVDLRVLAGDIFGFLGPNGAGKTTTLRILATLLPPTAGSARVAGFDVARQAREVRTRIGYVAQSGGSYREATGREELIIQGRLFGMSKADSSIRAAEILEALDLTDAADRTCGTYSGGMRRRLNIGIGMVHRPALLFLDEPTTGLDPQARARMWEEIRKLRETGTTVFLTTHYLEEADALCDRLAIIDHGKIVAEGSPSELKHDIAGDVVTIGVNGHADQVVKLLEAQPYVREACLEDGLVRLYVDSGEAAVPAVLRLLDAHGMAPSTMNLHRPSLDDVFLKKTGRSLRETAA